MSNDWVFVWSEKRRWQRGIEKKKIWLNVKDNGKEEREICERSLAVIDVCVTNCVFYIEARVCEHHTLHVHFLGVCARVCCCLYISLVFYFKSNLITSWQRIFNLIGNACVFVWAYMCVRVKHLNLKLKQKKKKFFLVKNVKAKCNIQTQRLNIKRETECKCATKLTMLESQRRKKTSQTMNITETEPLFDWIDK